MAGDKTEGKKITLHSLKEISEIQNQSDMVEMLDHALETLGDARYALLITIGKDGSAHGAGAGFASELELMGLKAFFPDLVDSLVDNTFGEES